MAAHAALASSRIPANSRLPSVSRSSFAAPAHCLTKKLEVSELSGLSSSGCVTFTKNVREASFFDVVPAQLTPQLELSCFPEIQ